MTDHTRIPHLDAAGDWTAIADQLRAHSRTITAEDSLTGRWIRGQAAIIRREMARTLPHVPPDMLAEVAVRVGAMLGDLAIVVDSGGATERAVGIAQTVVGHALVGEDETR